MLSVPYDHEGINAAVGSGDDPAGETKAITAFTAQVFADAVGPKLHFAKHPPKQVKARAKRAKVRFKLAARGAAGFECRLDGKKFHACSAKKELEAKRGRHTFRARALSPRGRPGATKSFKFRVLHGRRHGHRHR